MSEVNETVDIEKEEHVEVLELTDEQLDALLNGADDIDPLDKVDRTLFDERIIYLTGEVNEQMVNNVVPMVHYYNALDDKYEIPIEDRSPLKVYVNTGGGELYNGTAIQAAFEGSKTPIHTYAQGAVQMSMGLIIFLAGHKRFMSRHANFLYHELRSGMDVNTLAEMNNLVRHYSNLQDKMDKYIVERTKIPMKRLKNQRKKNLDWFIDFDTAKKYEMFDETI